MKKKILRRIFNVRTAAILLTGMFVFVSCQKKYLGPDLSYGTLFNRLLKMVVSSDAGITTHTFTYDADGLLTSHNILLKGKNPSRTDNSIAQYYRNAAGTIDSIKVTSTLDGIVSGIKKIYFSYSSGNKVAYSVVLHNVNDTTAMRDSSIYQYNGIFLIERTDYVAAGSASYSATPYRDLVFQYSGMNISNLIFNNTVTGSTQKNTTLISYGYDTSKAALPVNGFQYGYDSVCFVLHEYAALNNLSNIKYGEGAGVASASYEYNYLSNGKPFKGTSSATTAAGDALQSKIEFFYN